MEPIRKTYAGITATGARAAEPAMPYARMHAIQVKGAGAAPTSWSVTLEGSLNGTDWTTLATHNASDGSIVQGLDVAVAYVRANVVALTLGGATSITVGILSTP